MGTHKLVNKADQNKLKRRTVKVRIEAAHAVEGSNHFDTHREMVAHFFNKKGWLVINYKELKYFYKPDHVIVEGVANVSLLSM